jgi:hypothetical protein
LYRYSTLPVLFQYSFDSLGKKNTILRKPSENLQRRRREGGEKEEVGRR